MESGKCGCGPWGNTDTYGEAQRPGWYGTTFHVPTSKVQGPRSSLCFAVHGQWKVWESSLIGTYHGCGGPFDCSTVPVPVPISIYLSKVFYRKGTQHIHRPRSVVQRTSAPSDHAPLPPIGGAPFPLTVFGSPVPSPRRRSTRSHAIPFSRLAIPPPEHARGEEEKKRRMEE